MAASTEFENSASCICFIRPDDPRETIGLHVRSATINHACANGQTLAVALPLLVDTANHSVALGRGPHRVIAATSTKAPATGPSLTRRR